MGLREETRTIAGVPVTCVQFASRRSLRVAATVLKIGGPAVLAVAMGGQLSKLDIGDLTEALRGLEPSAVEELAGVLLAGSWAVVDGKKVEFLRPENLDVAFIGLGPLLQAMRFSLEVNFSDFFDGLSGGAGGTPGPAGSSSG